ncbi:hypothetical protein FX988_03620 [Paraglaciecola mesophila]|uniref:Uncharacterized protein n=1 Tax=Paraglaciecola mesophila TaxID=197222 RepID=A0A857JMQ2_9ALTE|nr:hypothetical protein [Paraglaciecola mesophila]QHJ13359.1 hypothetical protein FX988_03620 [Paraglaciecola mesophila]
MSSYDNAELLALWLEGKLTPKQRDEFEQRCIQDSQFAEQVDTAAMVKIGADDYSSSEVPKWNKAATFEPQHARNSWSWLSGVSFVTSALAIVLVLTGTQVTTSEGELRIRFGSGQSEQALAKLVDSKLDAFKQNQQEAFSLYAQTLQQQQLESASQLTNYLLTSSRKERREDFAELIKFVNQQRSDDQLFYARQLNQLQQDVYLDANGIKVDGTQQ